jgi:hypothetical protein
VPNRFRGCDSFITSFTSSKRLLIFGVYFLFQYALYKEAGGHGCEHSGKLVLLSCLIPRKTISGLKAHRIHSILSSSQPLQRISPISPKVQTQTANTLTSYAASRASNLSLPIPKSLAGLTSSLPIIAGVLLEGSYDLTHRRSKRNRSVPSPPPTALYTIIANVLILVYSTVVITLLGTHTGPTSSLLCGLNDRWLSLYRAKDGDAIRTIQDTFKCCGLHSKVDKAFPFPGGKGNVPSCVERFGWSRSCFESWRGAEQSMSGVLMGIVGLVVIWQVRNRSVASGSRRRTSPAAVVESNADWFEIAVGHCRRAIDALSVV